MERWKNYLWNWEADDVDRWFLNLELQVVDWLQQTLVFPFKNFLFSIKTTLVPLHSPLLNWIRSPRWHIPPVKSLSRSGKKSQQLMSRLTNLKISFKLPSISLARKLKIMWPTKLKLSRLMQQSAISKFSLLFRSRPVKSSRAKKTKPVVVFQQRFWHHLWPSTTRLTRQIRLGRIIFSGWQQVDLSYQQGHLACANHLRRLLRKFAAPFTISIPIHPRVKRLAHPFVFLFRHFTWQVFLVLTLSIFIMSGSYWLYVFIFKDLPSAEELTTRDQIVSSQILDRNGEELFSFYKDENRTIVTLDQIPAHMAQATIAIEDKDFYHHLGISPTGILRALLVNSNGETVQGGSTITQQLVKNTLLSPERTLQRKIREIILAVVVDATYSKNQILEMYFNQIPYGGATYGVEEAAQRFFDKSVTELNLAESALLAGLPAAPTDYSPFGAYPELAKYRQQEVLRRMVEDRYITQAEADQAAQTPLTFATDATNIKAPHFVMYVRDLLAKQYGEEMLAQGGLIVTTTLDLAVQNQAQAAMTAELTKLQRMRVSNGAALVTIPKTGEILAMVGSKDYFDFDHDGQVNVTIRPRQPGSSIKPVTYALALERGIITPSTLIQDSPITYRVPGSPPYSPANYDGKYHGNVSVRESLGSSYNIPAVKTLAQVGVDAMISKAEQMGISTWTDRKRFGLSLTLGGGEVLMTDMAKVYGTFANQGKTVDLNPILEVSNYKGEVLYRNTCALDGVGCPSRATLDPRVAAQISDILADNRARTPAFGPQSVLNIPGQQVAVKTGTTNSLRDNWTIGYTSDRLVATWVGNNDNTPMSYVASGITGASPIWNQIMRSLLSEENPHHFSQAANLVQVKICKATGTLPCTGCPLVVEEMFIPGTEPTKTCNPSSFQPKPSPIPGEPQRDQILEGVGF